jgi:hypothetical protein
MTGRLTGVKLYRGLAGLLLAQCLVAAGFLLLRQPAGIPPALRVKAVGFIGGIVATAACSCWWLSQAAGRLSATRPALAVAGGLAASLVRLAAPLVLLGWLQSDRAADLLTAPLRGLLTEMLITSYLVLLLIDILLHIAGRSQSHPERPSEGRD